MQQWSWVQRIYSGAYLPRDRRQILKYWQRSAVYCNCLQRLHNLVDGKDFIYRWEIRETSAVTFVAQRQRLNWPCRTRLTAWRISCFGCRDLQPLLSADCVHKPQSTVNCFVALSRSSEPCRQHFLGLLSFTLNSSFITINIFWLRNKRLACRRTKLEE